MKRGARLFALALCVPFLAGFALAEGQFAKLSLAEALAKAGEGKKVVMVDFFTTWCGPCKKLDAETWTDVRVNGWLAEHAVAIKLDAEKEKDAAKQHKIGAYPTMLFLKPDGTEIGRMVGFRSADAFLREAADLLAGKSRVDSARERVAGADANDPMLRKDLAEELARAGKDAEALEQYLWCWDHGLEHSASFRGVRSSFLISSIRELGSRYPPALEALRQRRDACETALLSGKVTHELTSDLATLNGSLGETERILRVYDALTSREELAQEEVLAIRRYLLDAVAEHLLEAGRYQDLLDGVGDYNAAVDEKIEFQKSTAGLISDPSFANMTKYNAVKESARYYEALLGVGRKDDAQALAERLIAFDPREVTYKRLSRCAKSAKALDEAEAMRARAKAAKQTAQDG